MSKLPIPTRVVRTGKRVGLIRARYIQSYLRPLIPIPIKYYTYPCIFIYSWIYLRSRLIGAKEVKGKTITFLDAHCECTEGWLEPLLNEIALNRKAVVCPIIDVISDDTFEYVTASDMTWGGFNWKLNFRWYAIYLYIFYPHANATAHNV